MSALPRLVATDLDGTLLRSDGTVSTRTVRVLDRASAEGVGVILVTGRPIRWLRHVYDQLAAPLPAICANGAVVYDPHTDTVLRAEHLLPDLLAEIVRRLRAEVPGVNVAVEVADGRQFWHEPGYDLRWDAGDPAVRAVEDPAELLAVPAVKLLARAGRQDPDAFVKTVAEALAGLAEATHSSNTGLVEISAAGVTKATGLTWYCARHRITPADVVAFGDMPNDVPMLTWAGRAVAVANAHPAVREIADETTDSNDADGVAAYLERLFRFGDRPLAPAQRGGDRWDAGADRPRTGALADG
jgi:Cof subfamily protein (haloacid dehalogenase superfamily)